MNIKSFSIAYFPVEDRLLLQARGDTGNHNFWVTRRAAALLNQSIRNLLAQIYERSGVRKEHMTLAQSFGEQYAYAAHRPYAETLTTPESSPLLIFRIDYGCLDKKPGQLALLDISGSGQIFTLDEEMLQAVNNLLIQQCLAANWKLDLKSLDESSTHSMSPSLLH